MEVEVVEVEEMKDIKVTVHCIGLFLPSKEIGPSLMMMSSNRDIAIYCVSLNKETAYLVSPLYEHSLLLSSEVGAIDMSLALFTGECLFNVVERYGCNYRLDKQYKSKELVKKMKEIIGHTLFIEIDRCYGVKTEPSALVKPFFTTTTYGNINYAFLDSDCEIDNRVIYSFLEMFKEMKEKKFRGQKLSFYDKYWKEVATRRSPEQRSALERSVEQLTLYCKTDMFYQKNDIIGLFKNWKQYRTIANYFIYQVLAMDHLYALYKILRNEPILIAPLWTMSIDALGQLYTFCAMLKNLFTTVITKPEQLIVFTHKDIPLSLFGAEYAGQLYNLLDYLISMHEVEELRSSLITAIKHPLITYCLLFKLEGQAHDKALNNKASLDPVLIHAVYTAYHSFITPPSLIKDITAKLPDDASFDLSSEEVTDDFHNVLIALHKEIERIISLDTPDQLQLYLKEGQKLIFKCQTPPLFFYAASNTNILTQESYNTRLCEKYVRAESLITLTVHEKNPILENVWQDEWDTLKETLGDDNKTQQYNIILFNASEMKQNADLECVKTLLFADLHNTVILREASDRFFHKRISHFFAETQTDLAMPHFHSKYCFETSAFINLPQHAIKETLIIPQCHTLSLTSLKNIINLMIYYQGRIKRVALIGTLSLLPLVESGQAFVDFVRLVSSRGDIITSLYNREEHVIEFATLLDKHWRLVKCESKRELDTVRNQIKHFAEIGHYSVLYHLKKEELLLELLPSSKGISSPLVLYCLYKAPNAGSKFPKARNFLLESLSTTERSCKAFESMEIGDLARHDCFGKPNALFIISKKTLLQLDKNEVLYLFVLLGSLYVIDCEEEEKKTPSLIDCLINAFRGRNKPNMRYSYIGLTNKQMK